MGGDDKDGSSRAEERGSSASSQIGASRKLQYAADVQQGGANSYEVVATSAATSGSYTDDCQLNATNQTVDCSHGSDLIQFPEWAAAVYNPGGN